MVMDKAFKKLYYSAIRNCLGLPKYANRYEMVRQINFPTPSELRKFFLFGLTYRYV